MVKATGEEFTVLKSGDQAVGLDANTARPTRQIARKVGGEVDGGRGLSIQTNLRRKRDKNKKDNSWECKKKQSSFPLGPIREWFTFTGYSHLHGVRTVFH